MAAMHCLDDIAVLTDRYLAWCMGAPTLLTVCLNSFLAPLKQIPRLNQKRSTIVLVCKNSQQFMAPLLSGAARHRGVRALLC